MPTLKNVELDRYMGVNEASPSIAGENVKPNRYMGVNEGIVPSILVLKLGAHSVSLLATLSLNQIPSTSLGFPTSSGSLIHLLTKAKRNGPIL